MEMENLYLAPEVEVLEVAVECGFNGSVVDGDGGVGIGGGGGIGGM